MKTEPLVKTGSNPVDVIHGQGQGPTMLTSSTSQKKQTNKQTK